MSADQATEAESLRYFGEAVAAFTGSALPVTFGDWRRAVDGLLAVTAEREIPVVIDEFPYLVKATPSLPSIVQAALAPRRAERLRSRGRLLLCGSALSFMGSLLSGDAPLRGRAGLELIVPTLDHRLAAQFWEIDDPRLAVRVHAIVGGTPACRREFVEGDTPSGPADFDDWVGRTVLNPSSPLFREARYLLGEEPGLRDPGLYHSVLSAVVHGNSTSGGIASFVGRKASDIAHPLDAVPVGSGSAAPTASPPMFSGRISSRSAGIGWPDMRHPRCSVDIRARSVAGWSMIPPTGHSTRSTWSYSVTAPTVVRRCCAAESAEDVVLIGLDDIYRH
ncbi:AAA family ATPase [Nocardia macrotermitis]|uniref:Uncharacterized protein n=1 Tax=Nocardia macrotermitis TaxID=2585198 RepID=A0A7K0CXY5_9NOCA|nr:hypothetical protein [Nocardia macrotermitis]MQY18370.1 hypothetical protein [Nocardia macrotermitis]